jgi:CheY-like chemotaxis protein
MVRAKPLIVVADDDSLIVELIGELLTEEGYNTLCCFSGKEAYRIIIKEQPDLVILDMQMERPDAGLMVLDLVRLTPTTEQIPVILCSADGQFLRQKAHHLKARQCEVLEKPFKLGELLEMISTLERRSVANRVRITPQIGIIGLGNLGTAIASMNPQAACSGTRNSDSGGKCSRSRCSGAASSVSSRRVPAGVSTTCSQRAPK